MTMDLNPISLATPESDGLFRVKLEVLTYGTR